MNEKRVSFVFLSSSRHFSSTQIVPKLVFLFVLKLPLVVKRLVGKLISTPACYAIYARYFRGLSVTTVLMRRGSVKDPLFSSHITSPILNLPFITALSLAKIGLQESPHYVTVIVD